MQVFTYSTISNNLPLLHMYYDSCFMHYVGIIKATYFSKKVKYVIDH